MKKINNKGFSLIEMSIVLIIIGLLVVGIMSSRSLLESARMTSFIRELTSYKTALYIFKSLNDRLPGDMNNDGVIGNSKGDIVIYEPTSTQFRGEYNGIPVAWRAGPFVDLYLEKLINFKPKIEGDGGSCNLASLGDCPNINYPIFKPLNVAYNGFYSHTNTVIGAGSFAHNILNGVHMWLTYINNNPFNSKIVKKIDQKIDDGLYQTGELRGRCYSGADDYSYDYAINNKLPCQEMEYRVFVFN